MFTVYTYIIYKDFFFYKLKVYLIKISKALGSTSFTLIVAFLFSAKGPSNMALKTGDLRDKISDLASILSVNGSLPIYN